MLRKCFLFRFTANVTSRPTPNPDCLQFRPLPPLEGVLPPDCPPCEIPYRSLSSIHPLSEIIFEHYEKEVRSVFLSENYVAVTKWSDIRWNTELERSISGLIGSFLLTNDLVEPDMRNVEEEEDFEDYDYENDNEEKNSGEKNQIKKKKKGLSFTVDLENDSEVLQCVKELLVKEVRPLVQRDGGDVKLMAFDELNGIVKLKMLGACRSCPSSENTLKEGIERMLQHYVPEVKEVVEYKTTRDTRMDEMSEERLLNQQKQKEKQQGEEENRNENENDNSSSDQQQQKSPLATTTTSLHVSGTTVTAKAPNWNVKGGSDFEKFQQEQQQQEQKEKEESLVLKNEISKQLKQVEKMKNQGFIDSRSFSSNNNSKNKNSRNHENNTTTNLMTFGGITNEDVEASKQREIEIERLLEQEAEEKKAKWGKLAKLRAERMKRQKSIGLDEPEG